MPYLTVDTDDDYNLIAQIQVKKERAQLYFVFVVESEEK